MLVPTQVVTIARSTSKASKVLELHKKNLTRQEMADATGMGIASVYRILKAAA